MANVRYGYGKQLESTSVDRAVERVTEALKAEGFGVLTTIDVQDTLKKKIGAEFRGYRILGACNPTLAHRSLEAEPDIGLLLPCNVVVQEGPNGSAIVSIADPKMMFTVVDNPAVAPIADEVDAKLRRVLAAL